MILIKPRYDIFLSKEQAAEMLTNLEVYARTCYKSHPKGGYDGTLRFIKGLLVAKPGDVPHESPIEHEKITVRVVCDRGVSHELVRHRIASYSQESTRYCDYNKGHVTFVIPPWVAIAPGEYICSDTMSNPATILLDSMWWHACAAAEKSYKDLRRLGWKPEQARSVLPNSLATEIIITMNLRSWRHFFKLRTARAAHPQMREITIPMLANMKELMPVMFDDIQPAVL